MRLQPHRVILRLILTTMAATTIAAPLTAAGGARAEAIDCARCREICQTRAYPDGAEPDMHSGRLVHRSPEAKKAFEAGVAADPGLGGKDARRAVEAYKHAVLKDPDNAPYRNHLAAALLTASQFQEAIYNLEKAAALVPSETKYIVNLGYAWHRSGDEQRALVHYMRALILDPRDLRARLFTGYALELLGMGSEATLEFRRVLLTDPDNAGARAGLARLGKEVHRSSPGGDGFLPSSPAGDEVPVGTSPPMLTEPPSSGPMGNPPPSLLPSPPPSSPGPKR